MFELPLFPLQSVLFPGMPITLHVFEIRYKLMIEGCVARGQPFGVVLIKRGREVGQVRPELHAIGCTAKIVQVHHLDPKRMNVVAVGRERFRILGLIEAGAGYLRASADAEPLEIGSAEDVNSAAYKLFPWVNTYLRILSRLNDMDFESDFLPKSSLPLAYIAAHLLQIPAVQKQEILTAGSAVEMLETLQRIYRREVALLNALDFESPPDDLGMFSMN